MTEEIKNIIYKLVNNLDLGEIVEEPSRVMGGLLNRMYKITTTKGKYAIKHLNPEVMKRPTAKKNHILAEKVANIAKNSGIDCLPAKIFNNNALQELEGNYFFVYNWFEGSAIKDTEITLEHVKKVATLLAKLHNIDYKDLKNEFKLDASNEEVNWDFYIEKVENNEIKELLINKKEYLTALDKKATIAREELKNIQVISHRDLDLPNILWDKNNNPVIIDWESSSLVNPQEELIETSWDWSGGQDHFDKNKFLCFINTYKKINNITSIDKAISANFKNKAGWLEYNLKRVCKLECLDEEEQRLGEKEVIRVIKEIETFYETMKELNINE